MTFVKDEWRKLIEFENAEYQNMKRMAEKAISLLQGLNSIKRKIPHILEWDNMIGGCSTLSAPEEEPWR